jgi:hypothetical protein
MSSYIPCCSFVHFPKHNSRVGYCSLLLPAIAAKTNLQPHQPHIFIGICCTVTVAASYLSPYCSTLQSYGYIFVTTSTIFQLLPLLQITLFTITNYNIHPLYNTSSSMSSPSHLSLNVIQHLTFAEFFTVTLSLSLIISLVATSTFTYIQCTIYPHVIHAFWDPISSSV